MSDLHPIEVVSRGSETQLLVGENLNKLPEEKRFDNYSCVLSFLLFKLCMLLLYFYIISLPLFFIICKILFTTAR